MGGGGGSINSLKFESYLAVLQVGVDVFDEGVVGVSGGEGQLAERTATNSALFRLHPQLQTEANGKEVVKFN